MKPLAFLSAAAAMLSGSYVSAPRRSGPRPRPLPRVTEGDPSRSRRAQRFGDSRPVYKQGPHPRSYVAALAGRRTKVRGGGFAVLSNGMWLIG